MNDKLIKEATKNMLAKEEYLSPYATKSQDALRFYEEQNDFRSPFFRDIDRIIYSLSFHRYIDKTQVFSLLENDHVSKRIIHVQFVSKIARTIGRALKLNEDLIEAIALGHDLGHVPFGHVGEYYLNEVSLFASEGYFNHNVESVRVLMMLENNGKGSNLCVQTLDGIMCHNGEFPQNEYHPKKKTKEEFLVEYEETYTNPNIVKTLKPMTLEGCVVRISDIIAYLGRDIEDAIRLGIIKSEDLPESVTNVLGTTNKEIINIIILDIIANSMDKPYIKMSKEVYDAIVMLKSFNYKYIYDKANSSERKEEIRMMFFELYEALLKDIQYDRKDANIFKVFLNDMNELYLENTSNERKVIDFIAGMTDDYFMNEYNLHKTQNN